MSFEPDPENPEQIDVIATALANARGGRRGAPRVKNALEMLETMGFRELAGDLRDDAQDVLRALRDL